MFGSQDNGTRPVHLFACFVVPAFSIFRSPQLITAPQRNVRLLNHEVKEVGGALGRCFPASQSMSTMASEAGAAWGKGGRERGRGEGGRGGRGGGRGGAGRGGGGRGRHRSLDPSVALSKNLSELLRHGALRNHKSHTNNPPSQKLKLYTLNP